MARNRNIGQEQSGCRLWIEPCHHLIMLILVALIHRRIDYPTMSAKMILEADDELNAGSVAKKLFLIVTKIDA